MKFLTFILIIIVNLSCLTAITRRISDYELELSDLDPFCEDIARGLGPKTLVTNWPNPVKGSAFLIAPFADLAIIYTLSLTQPWSAFGYFGIGYMFAGYETFPPKELGGWCGKPESPTKEPANHFYFSIRKDNTSTNQCIISPDLRRKISSRFINSNIQINDEEIDRIIEKNEFKFSTYPSTIDYECVVSVMIPYKYRHQTGLY